MEKENSSGAVQGDRPSIIQAKKIIVDALTKEQEAIPRDHHDWMILEDMKESILRETDFRVINSKIKILSEILELISAERLHAAASV